MDIRLISKLRTHPESSFKKGASERMILLAEKRLGIEFPPSYRDFLSQFNGGEFVFARTYRISRGGAGFFDLQVEMTRAEYFRRFRERTLLLFGDDYGGNYYCFDMSRRSKKRENPIVRWDHFFVDGDDPVFEANDLSTFIKNNQR